ncbi:MAG: hypothetical protein A3K65_06835 [Euryarchaeota archaeon RBG_16_68_12]|nr:MAG: hypothetical protein A3K65_06835 [Euryarchaeota archaeon RBG_16_68_12]
MRLPPARALALLAVLAAAVLVLGGLPPPAAAGPEPPSRVATAYNTQRKLAAAPDGTLYAAVSLNVSGVPTARVLARAPGGDWTALYPPTTTGNASDRTSLAIDSRGRLHLAWTEAVSTDRQVFYARYEGGVWTPALQLSHSVGYAGFPSIAVDARDRAHVAWYATPDGVNYQILYRRLEASGWTSERALTSASSDATNPALALGPDGVVHVVWSRLARQVSTRTEVAYLRLEGDEVVEELALSAPLVSAATPSLVVAGNGTVHVVWSGDGRIQHVEWDGRWLPVETISSGSPAAANPTLALDPLGRLHVFWDAADGGIYHQVRNGTWSAPEAFASGGRNVQPSTRWSQFGNPLCGPNAGVDVIWTRDAGGVLSLEYRRIDVPTDCPPPAPVPTPAIWVAGGLASLGAGAAFVAVSRRARRRTPPRSPP